MENVITNGKHYISGIGRSSLTFDDNVEVVLLCIDGETYGAYTDPYDGYRSYGCFQKMENEKCQYLFPPQPIIVKFEKIEESVKHESGITEDINREMLYITDAINGKEILSVGTDSYDYYYPIAIFNYSPQNFHINQNK